MLCTPYSSCYHLLQVVTRTQQHNSTLLTTRSIHINAIVTQINTIVWARMASTVLPAC
jgi:hypothetical protein